MVLEDEKEFKRDLKALQNYIYHVRTEMTIDQSKKEGTK